MFPSIQDFVAFAKQWPSPATVIVLCAVLVWASWAHTEGFARAEDIKEIKTAVDGFAKMSEVQQVKDDVAELRVQVQEGRAETIEGQLFDAKVEQCKASAELRRTFAQRVASLQARYRQITGENYSTPNCDEL